MWKKIKSPLGLPSDQVQCWESLSGLFVIVTPMTDYPEYGKWGHVSCSRKDKIPSYQDLKEVKDRFVGVDKLAIQVFPPKSNHVNIHPYALHLWAPESPESHLPDFTRGTGMI